MKRPVFESGCELLEVTSLHRPDTDWSFTDSQQHIHHWYVAGEIAKTYIVANMYELPTLQVVQDPPEITEYGDELKRCHYECKQCGQVVSPGFRSDSYRQYIPGMRWYRIDGKEVTEEEYLSRILLKDFYADNFSNGSWEEET